MIRFIKKNIFGVVIDRSLEQKEIESLKLFNFNFNTGILQIFTNENDIKRSARLRKKIAIIMDDLIRYFRQKQTQQFITFSHTLKKIIGQSGQKIDGLLPHPLYSNTENYSQRKNIVVELVKKNPSEAADTLMYLQKRIFEFNAHMLSFELLHMGENFPVEITQHNIRRLILNIWHSFGEIFQKKHLRYKFEFEDSVAEENKWLLDYKTFSAALFNIFDNLSKYACPDSEINFVFEITTSEYSLKISMFSYKIEDYEVEKLCDLGFRGSSCKQVDGTGVGLYIAKKAFDLNSLIFDIIPNNTNTNIYNGTTYFLNTFCIRFQLD